MKKKRIVYLTNYPSPYRVDFFNLLGKFSDLTVLFTEKAIEQKHRNSSWFNEDYVFFNAVFLEKEIKFCGKKLFLDVIYYLKQNWDVIISGGYDSLTQILAFEWLRFHGKEFVIESDGGFIKNDNFLKYHVKKHLISSASNWLSTGDFATEYLCHYGATKDKIYKYPFTSLWKSDIEKAKLLSNKSKCDIRLKLGIKEKYVVISVGRFTYNRGYGKGFDLLLDMAPALQPDVGIYIIGDEATPDFVDKKEKKGLVNVHYIGFKKKEELAYYYAAADLFVLLTRSDVWGLVVNEAMSFSLPIITTTKCGAGLTLVRDNENGFLVGTDDFQTPCDKIKLLIDNKDLRTRLGKNSFRKIERYTMETSVETHLALFSKIKGD